MQLHRDEGWTCELMQTNKKTSWGRLCSSQTIQMYFWIDRYYYKVPNMRENNNSNRRIIYNMLFRDVTIPAHCIINVSLLRYSAHASDCLNSAIYQRNVKCVVKNEYCWTSNIEDIANPQVGVVLAWLALYRVVWGLADVDPRAHTMWRLLT